MVSTTRGGAEVRAAGAKGTSKAVPYPYNRGLVLMLWHVRLAELG
jgi:hypothetical protein